MPNQPNDAFREILSQLNIEVNKPFKVRGSDEMAKYHLEYEFLIDEKGHGFYRQGTSSTWIPRYWLLADLFVKNLEVLTGWQPDHGDPYYYIDINTRSLINRKAWLNTPLDAQRLSGMGVYPTYEDAKRFLQDTGLEDFINNII